MFRTLRLLLCLASALVVTSSPVAAKRLALVIGNNDYRNLPKLERAVNDARAMASTLEEIGFEVTLGVDLSRRETNRTLAEFETAIAPGDQAFIYFAGHGVALGGENLLIPVDMPKPRAGEDGLVRDEAHAVSDLIDRVQRRGAVSSIFVLDACRNNPFEASGVRSIGVSRGLTRVEAPRGVFVLFSAGTGQTALDRLSDADDNPNSVFTRKLIPLLKVPGLTHVRLAKQVQQEVSQLARTVSHPQQPAYYDQIIGEIVLRPSAAGNDKPLERTPASTRASDAAQAWTVIQNTASPAVLKAFIDRFPKSLYADFARARLSEVSHKTAAAPPARKAPEEPEPPRARLSSGQALVEAIQTALNRHGCDAGPVDGAWGKQSSRAVEAFARQTGSSLDPIPSERLLSALEARRPKACANSPATVSREPAEPNGPPPAAAQKTFTNPVIGGLPLDICLTRGARCKGAAADAFCRRRGYRVATASNVVIYPATRHIGSGGVCKPRGLVVCGGYSTITCAR